jgi:hypothetical protein
MVDGDLGLVDMAVEDIGDLADFCDEFGELFGEDRLHAVGEGFLWLVMDFDEQAVCTYRDGCARKRQNFVALAGAVGRIDENWEMTPFFDGGDDRKI